MKAMVHKVRPIKARERQQGLQVLARMIAKRYVSDIRDRSQDVTEPDKGISPEKNRSVSE